MGSPIEIKKFLNELSRNLSFPLKSQTLINIQDTETLARFIGPKSFITITNLVDARKTVIGEHSRPLGYSKIEYTLEKSLQIIPGVYGIIVYEYGKSIYEMLHMPEFIKKINHNSIYSISYPARHAAGHLVKITRISKCLCRDEQERIASNINICMIESIPNRPIITKPQLQHVSQNFYEAEQRKLERRTIPRILKAINNCSRSKSILSDQEYKVARQQAAGLSSSMIAKQLKLSVYTIHQHSKSIKQKIETLFHHTFRSSKDASVFLDKLGFLDYDLNSAA